MKRLANGDVRYPNDFWFDTVFVLVSLIGFPGVAWVELTHQPPNYVMGVSAIIGSIWAVYGVFYVQRATFLFSPSKAVMTWTARGLVKRGGGEVGFADLVVTIDAGKSFSWFGRSNPLSRMSIGSPMEYDVMLTTPTSGRTYLWRGHECPSAVREATDLRGLLGQNAGSLVEDSIAQMLQDGNKMGAEALRREVSKAARLAN